MKNCCAILKEADELWIHREVYNSRASSTSSGRTQREAVERRKFLNKSAREREVKKAKWEGKAMMYPWLTFLIGKSHKSPTIIPTSSLPQPPPSFIILIATHYTHAIHHPLQFSITARDGLNFSVCNFSFSFQP